MGFMLICLCSETTAMAIDKYGSQFIKNNTTSTIIKKVNSPQKMFIRRLLGSPLKVMAFLTTAVGLLAIFTFSYFFFLGIYLLGIGLLLYIIDFALSKLLKNRRVYGVGQAVLTLIYLVLVFVFYMR